jgi:hypothetical protein
MYLTTNNNPNENRAEKAFRDAFDRLKNGQSIKLAKGTRVSQNNIAKEAGCDPSALKKSRYPVLIAEIQAWLQEHPTSVRSSSRQRIIGQRNKNHSLQERIAELTAQRDLANSLLVQADAEILDLVRKIARLEARQLQSSNLVEFRLKDEARQQEYLQGVDGLSHRTGGAIGQTSAAETE